MSLLYLHNGTRGFGDLGVASLFCRGGCECSAGSDGWLTVHGALRLNDKTLLTASVQPCVTAAGGVHGGSKASFDSRWSGHQREISTPKPLDS